MTAASGAPSALLESDFEHVSWLFSHLPYSHLHLDWHSLEEWLPHPNLRCRVFRRAGAVDALIGATLHLYGEAPPDRIAWLRFIVLRSPTPPDPVLDDLWAALRADLQAAQVGPVALLAMDDWPGELAARWGFEQTSAVITMSRSDGPEPAPPPPGLRIRPVESPADLAEAVRVDHAAFGALWRYDAETLAVAQAQAATFTLLEQAGQVIGYQLSTLHQHSGHLARLAILPREQGRGLAALLIGDVLRFFKERGIHILTVNTQKDNTRSRHLYSRLGFTFTGLEAPIWTFDLQPSSAG